MQDSSTSLPTNGNGLSQAALEFVETGMTTVYLPVLEHIPLFIEGADDLIDDEELRERWALKINRPGEPTNDWTDGLIRRSGGPEEDKKWYFHYRAFLRQHLLNMKRPIGRHQQLLIAANRLFVHCNLFAHRFAEHLDRAMPGLNIAQLMQAPEAQDLHVLRLLKYDRGTQIGKSHTDQSLFTMHVAESRPGLHTGSERKPYIAEANRVLIFPGDKMERLTRGKIKALPHEVLDESDSPLERWAIVYFAHISNLHIDEHLSS